MSTLPIQIFQPGTQIIAKRRVISVNKSIIIERGILCTVQLQFEDDNTREPLLNLVGKISAFPANAFEELDT
ncbi:MAG: hypothetical protein Q7R64_04375 [bacterium]|nr:hypothetical protein [bacterium]